MRTFTHIINPFAAPPGSEHALAQPVTFASIERALREVNGKAEVTVNTVMFPDEQVELPAVFRKLSPLERSSGQFGLRGRKLPLLSEILQKVLKETQSEYIIFTNIDICLMPNFYFFCNEMAEKGHDAFVINRRRIPAKFKGAEDLELMYAEAGETHTGYDTFVFKRSLAEKFLLGNSVVGVPYFDTLLIHNLYAFAENFRLYTRKHVCFHIGMLLHKTWGDQTQVKHNYSELRKYLRQLKPHFNIENFPGASLGFFSRHFKWLMNPTFVYPLMFSLDLKQLGRKRRKYPEDGTEGQRYLNRIIRKINFPEDE